MRMQKHILTGGITLCLALAITLLLSTYGADGVRGFIAVYAGYPGAAVNWRLFGHMNYLLITSVNWLSYFGVAEGLAIAFRRLSSKKP